MKSIKNRLARVEKHTTLDITSIVWLTLLESGEYEVSVSECRKGNKDRVMKFKTEKEVSNYIETTVGDCIVWDIPPQ